MARFRLAAHVGGRWWDPTGASTPPPVTMTVPDGLTREHPMRIARHRIVSVLRARGQQARADWVERELPERVNPDEHTGLLATLRLDPADLADPLSP